MMLAISAGILGLFAVITLFFSISKYIKDNQQNMGILKAMGYERKRIATEFIKFSFNAFLGSLLAIAAGMMFQPLFYREMMKEAILPDITPSFHPVFALILLVLPGITLQIQPEALKKIDNKSSTKDNDGASESLEDIF